MKLCAIDNQVVLEVEGTAIPVKSYKISSSAQGGTELEATIVVGINVMKAEIATIQVPSQFAFHHRAGRGASPSCHADYE